MKYFKILSKENIIISTLTFYIFFWDMFLTLGIKFDIRLVLFVISFFLIKEIFNDFKKNNYNFIYLSIVISFLLTIHSLFVGNLLNLKFFLSICFVLYIFGIAYYYSQTILNNKKKIIILFISLFLISIFVHYIIGFSSNPEPFSCGGLKNFLGGKDAFDKPLFLIHFLSSYSLIFNENSHLAMSCVPIIIYSIYLYSERKENKISLFILTIFLLIAFLKSSATLLAGTVFSILVIFIFEYKRLSKYFLISSISLLIILSSVFFTDKVCLDKVVLDVENKKQFENFNPLSKTNAIEDLMVQINQLLINDKKIDLELKEKLKEKLSKLIQDENLSDEIKKELINIQKLFDEFNKIIPITSKKKLNEKDQVNFKNKLNKIEIELKESKETIIEIREKELDVRGNYIGSLSSEVFYHALKVSYHSFFLKPFGWGFQGYELAFNNYNKTHNVFKKSLGQYNNKDASNNTFKIITEFGIFSFLLYFLLLYIFFSNKISLENKIFLLPFIVTQSIRGAGYFNGAFVLMLFLLIILQFKNSKNENN